jgi:hypothetical protein
VNAVKLAALMFYKALRDTGLYYRLFASKPIPAGPRHERRMEKAMPPSAHKCGKGTAAPIDPFAGFEGRGVGKPRGA